MAYYFGCWSKDRIGHSLYTKGGISIMWSAEEKALPKALQGASLDNLGLTGKGQSKIFRKEIEGYTLISMEDRSADTRSGSNSSFFIKGSYTTPEMIELFLKHYPEQAKRINNVHPFYE